MNERKYFMQNTEKIEKVEQIKDVIQLLDWQFGKITLDAQNVEEYNEKYYKILGWNDEVDVLYSIIALYALGLCAYYPEKYDVKQFRIFRQGTQQNRAYSAKHVEELYKSQEARKLNQNQYLREFAKISYKIGNVVPIWPGGNEDKGKDDVFDLPDLYFKKHEFWTKALENKYRENIFLEELLDSNWIVVEHKNRQEYNSSILGLTSTPDFLKSLFDEKNSVEWRIALYNTFLERINYIIETRTKKLNEFIRTHV